MKIEFFELFLPFRINRIVNFRIESNEFRTNSNLTPPLIHSKTDKIWQCEKCDKSFSVKHSLKLHDKTVHNETKTKEYQCDICAMSYHYKETLESHRFKYHYQNSDSIQCDICKKYYADLKSFKHHKMRKHQKREFKCNLCSKDFVLEREVNLHMKRVHCKSRRKIAK